MVAPAEASANLSRFDGVRYGYRCDNPVDLEDMYKRSRSEGFGEEVKRRIMVGAYALSAGFYDAYYRKAQKIRRLVKQDFNAAFQQVDIIIGPTSPHTAFNRGAKTDPVAMYLEDIYTVAVNLAGLPGMSVPAGLANGLPVGMHLVASDFAESRLLNVAHQFQLNTDWHRLRATAFEEGTDMEWEAVIGLEVHVSLSTNTKLFSGTASIFGAEPNTEANIFDLAMPGTLPVLNKEALRMAVKFGLAIDAEIGKRSVFDRKNYFYPDLPKGYQVTQLNFPTVGKGSLTITLEDGSERQIGVTRAHIEENAGKSLHEDFHGMSGIDLNRSGEPLLEIVSEPEIRNAKEAVAYLKKLHAIVRYLDISDAIMAQGSMRCDVNVSIRPKGSTELGTRTELKNINSFRFVEKAINSEIQRQQDVLEDGGT